MGIFSGIKDAQITGASKYLGPGQWYLKVKKCEVFESSKKKGRFFFLAEFETLEATDPHSVVGETRSWLVNLDQEAALGNIKAFALALTPDAKESDIDEEMVEELVSSENPAAGLEVRAEGVLRESKNGNEYTRFTWSSS